MASLAELPNLAGFFSYSREDDEDFRGELSVIRASIGRNLAALLGRKKRYDFDLWQDVEAIAPGKLWEMEITKAIEASVFFIPIVTPRAVQSHYCRDEFEAFLAREKALGRNDLVFPILYMPVPALGNEAKRRNDRVLAIVAERQFVDWSLFRYEDINSPTCRQKIGRFCEHIVETLHETWISPDERAKLEAEAEERERPRKEALAKNRAPLTAALERALKPGDSFKEGADCPEMVVVPPGRFLMGSPEGEGDKFGCEQPQHEVTIARPFAVAKFALTFDEWDACTAHGGCRTDVSDEGWGRGRRPAINVSWEDARAYVNWLSSITGKRYRLLSEAEWEYAARAGSQTKYSWGDDIMLNGKAMANGRYSGSEWSGMQTAPVGSFAPNAFGLYDMIGNVSEWTEDVWNYSYSFGPPADGSAWTHATSGRRVFRGGSWYENPDSLRSAYRYAQHTGVKEIDRGLRVARTLNP
ncbi:MAG: SUMF1/EgtB/PvdO family nonheme iron enzyme [Hyphomicrobiales bacterium]|nr:SUMF1/EgtB/PvdO family nonheme iron enzyme [Hyphomicrobiales bacterium]